MSDNIKEKFEMLIIKAQEGLISDEEINDLNELLMSPDNQKLYFEMVKLNCALRQLDVQENQSDKNIVDGSICDISLLLRLAQQESNAPAIEVTTESTGYNKKISSLIFGIPISVAAIIILAVSIQFLQVNHPTGEATLIESINAIWAENNSIPGIESKLFDQKGTYSLHEGTAKILLNSGAQVTIESPSAFQIFSENKIKLLNGSIYAIVPEQAVGFSVVTPKCNIVDLGTEFGVMVDSYGNTELHVNKGKTIISTEDSREYPKQTLEVTAGQACKIGDENIISNIPCQSELFVRNINKSTGMIWRGEYKFNLADVVGGGNGWSSNTFIGAINPDTGSLGAYITDQRPGSGNFNKLISAPYAYIDGVFVPGNSAQDISSLGHKFNECPKTNCQYYADIVNDIGLKMYDSNNRPNLKMNNINNSPSIIMHSNSGITFDLNEIRKDLPDGNLSKFTTTTGLSLYRPTQSQRTSYIPREAKAQVWVLLDGDVVFSSILDRPGDAIPVEIDISDTARFLTLITTDGTDSDNTDLIQSDNNDSDWCIFAKPELIINNK